MRRITLVVGFLILGISPSSYADVFKWIDDAGNVHYGDSPPDSRRSESIEFRVDTPGPPDEAEQRRLRALKQADEAAKVRMEKRSTEKRKREDMRRQESITEGNCMHLRRQLDILKYQMPAYRGEDGDYRVKWEEDYYEGKRVYIDGSTRVRVMKNIQSQINSQCAHQDSSKANREAHRQNVFAEKCNAARVKLRLIENPERRASESEIEARMVNVRHYCGE